MAKWNDYVIIYYKKKNNQRQPYTKGLFDWIDYIAINMNITF